MSKSKTDTRPTYKISSSLINAYLYHMGTHQEYSYNGLVESIKGIYHENKWSKRGHKFEREVSSGQHPQISDLLDPLKKQVWADQKFLETKSFRLMISGKADAYDEENGIIYDTKRIDRYFDGKYSEQNTIQHLLYFYLFPEAKKFVYLIAYGEGDTVEGYTTLTIERPKEEELKKEIVETIVDFISYLKYKGLWKTYQKHQKAKKFHK